MFIRMGIENLLRQIDPSPTFVTLNKEDPEEWRLKDDPSIDKIIWCGMPLFWSFPSHYSQEIFWWDGLIRPIIKSRSHDFAVLGAGTAGFISPDFRRAFTRPHEILSSINEIADSAAAFTMRDDCVHRLIADMPAIEVLPCPAIFSSHGIEPCHHHITCNLMPDLGHYPELEPQAHANWKLLIPVLATTLLQLNSFFCPHTMAESELASSHGWQQAQIAPPFETLKHLSGTGFHIGNRIHAAIVAASTGSKSIAMGYDLRLRAAQLCGCEIIHMGAEPYPFDKPKTKPNLEEVKNRYLEILRKFTQL